MNNRPIGFIDSGVGGLSVVKEVMKQLPGEEIQFIGDSARNPYGTRSTEEVLQFTRELAVYLLSQNIKMLVIACNTATAAALEQLQKELSIPVIGVIESGSKNAILHSKNKKIGVIGTESTIQSKAYNKKINEYDQAVEIFSLASPKFVELVENNYFEDSSIKKIVQSELSELKKIDIDSLILGCTHYPLLQPYIQDYLGTDIYLIDPSIETVKDLKNILISKDLINETKSQKINHTFYTTDKKGKFEKIARNWLPNQNFQVKHVSIEEIKEKWIKQL